MEEKEFFSYEQFEKAVQELIKKIEKEKFKPEVVYALPRGGLCLGTRLAYHFKVPLIMDPEKCSGYMKILLADDVSDTGRTLLKCFPKGDYDCKIATIHYKPWSRVKPDYYVIETKAWIDYWWEV